MQMKKFYKHKIKPSKRLIHRGLKSLTRRYCAITILLLFNLHRYKSYSILSKLNENKGQLNSVTELSLFIPKSCGLFGIEVYGLPKFPCLKSPKKLPITVS